MSLSESNHFPERLTVIWNGTAFVWDEARPDFTVTTKIRTIDPEVLANGQARPLSQLNPAFGAARQAYFDGKKGAWPMRVKPP